MTARCALAVAMSMMLCQPAAAADEPWYAGVAAAFSRPDIDGAQASASIGARWAGTPTTVDNKGDGLKLYGGWQASRSFAVELGYTDFGRTSTYSTLLGPTSRDTASVQWEGQGLDVSALGHWRIGEVFSLYARGGASAWEIERKIVEDGTAGHFVRSGKETGVSGLAGAGFAIRFTERGTLRAEFQRYFNVGGEAVGGRTDIDMVSIGAHYHF